MLTKFQSALGVCREEPRRPAGSRPEVSIRSRRLPGGTCCTTTALRHSSFNPLSALCREELYGGSIRPRAVSIRSRRSAGRNAEVRLEIGTDRFQSALGAAGRNVVLVGYCGQRHGFNPLSALPRGTGAGLASNRDSRVSIRSRRHPGGTSAPDAQFGCFNPLRRLPGGTPGTG